MAQNVFLSGKYVFALLLSVFGKSLVKHGNAARRATKEKPKMGFLCEK